MTPAPRYRSEADVKRAVKKLLTAHGYFWWMPPANGYGKTGIADINALKSGVFVAVETKFGGNTPTRPQRDFLRAVQAQSSFGFVVCEDRVAWLEAWLQAFDRAAEASARQQPPRVEDGATMLNAIAEMTRDLA